LKRALVIHPVLSFQAGGEFLCINVCAALQAMGYRVSLASDVFRPSDFERMYGIGGVMEKCEHIQIPQFTQHFNRFMIPQRLLYSQRVWPMFADAEPDIVFSTQSSPFIIPQRIFHFVYNVSDVYGYPPAAAKLDLRLRGSVIRRLYSSMLKEWGGLLWRKRGESKDWFFAVGTLILADLRARGYLSSSLVFPPCRIVFKPSFPKKKQVVQAARMIPDKGLERYLDIASRLPDYTFHLIGRDSPLLRRLYPGYSKKILSSLPRNVVYVDTLVGERPELLGESKIYLYTGNERGIGLAVVEALSAGCVPFSPPSVGAVDIINASKFGVIYRNAEEAVTRIRSVLEEEHAEAKVLAMSEKARQFSPESFQQWVRNAVGFFEAQSRAASPLPSHRE